MKFNKELLNKGLSVLTVVAAGAGAVVTAVSNNRKEQEFEELKKAVSELQKK